MMVWMAGSTSAGDWPQFRGPARDGISTETGLLRQWPEGGPKVLWSVDVCQGYAGSAIVGERVFFNDYDEKNKEWLARCLDFKTGSEVWRYKEAKLIRANHGITRTVPAADEKHVFSFDPKCVFHCLDALTGKEIWRKELVQEYKATIPAWYNGQCPLLDGDRVIIATGGTALLVALEKASGKVVWEAPNPDKIPMSHSSVMLAEIGGMKQYLYMTLGGCFGISAQDGRQLWFFPWKFNIAVPTSALHVGDGKIFLTSCYEADGAMIQVKKDGDKFTVEQLFKMAANDWNSEVHTPILFQNHMFAVGKKQRGLFTCLDMDGKQVWTSEAKASFGLGSYLLADGMFFVLEGDTGMLRVLEANTKEYRELAKIQVLSGHDVWAPMALSNGKLVLRDMTKMVCIDVKGSK